MTDKQENKLSMYYTVSAVCESNVEVWQDNETFKTAFQVFVDKLPIFESLRNTQETENADYLAGSSNITRMRFSRSKYKAASIHLKKLFRETDEFIFNRLDKEILEFKDDAPDFYYQYHAARIMIYPATYSKTKKTLPLVEN